MQHRRRAHYPAIVMAAGFASKCCLINSGRANLFNFAQCDNCIVFAKYFANTE